MIVRNEQAIIERCLASVSGFVDCWAISDTGSTDDTVARIEKALARIPGKIFHDEWRDFGHNRTVAIRHANTLEADYLLMIDADMELRFDPEAKSRLAGDAVFLRVDAPVEYSVPRLFRNAPSARFVGVTHEYLDLEPFPMRETASGIWIVEHIDGSSRSEKYDRDIRLLKKAIEAEPENPRSWFYLGQSYRESNQFDLAIEAYEKRASLEGWDEERWYAQYQLARCRQMRGDPWLEVQQTYLDAYEARPFRLEPLLHLARYYRELGMMNIAYMFSRAWADTEYPKDILFVERNVYRYELATEYAVACYWVGLHEEAVRVNELILRLPNLPLNYEVTAHRNRQLSLEVLAKQAA